MVSAPVRAAADALRKAIAARLGVTGLVALDQAADLPWLLDTAEHILDAAERAGRDHDRVKAVVLGPEPEPVRIPPVAMDCYDAIDIVAAPPDAPSRLLAATARRAADLWNDPDGGGPQRDNVRAAFPELGAAMDELLGGGPAL